MDLRMSEIPRVTVHGLRVAKILHDFVVDEALPGTGIEAASFWQGLDRIVHQFAPLNRALLARRDDLQAKIDNWYREHRGRPFELGAYKAFLTEIGYLVPGRPGFQRRNRNVDDGDRRRRRAAARRADQQRALCAQRRQCALGLAL